MPIPCLIMQTINPLDELFADAKTHGVSMSALCEKAGIAETTPSRWKKGRTSPTLEKLMELRAALNAIVLDRAA